jgi:hypothetical protein
MEISVEFRNKDLVKKLGCKWICIKEQKGDSLTKYGWVCPLDNSSKNIEKLIKLQDKGTIGFRSGKTTNGNRPCIEGEITFWISMGGPTGFFDICLNEKQIYETINNVFRLPKNEDLFIEDEPYIEKEKEIDDKIKKLTNEKKKKYDEMIKKQEQERLQFEESYNEELTHLNNCKFRDYDQDIRSFN